MRRIHRNKRTVEALGGISFENVPKDINYNEFYCYSTKTGVIFIGTVIGKSAMTLDFRYSINGFTHYLRENEAFSEDRHRVEIRNANYVCFQNYDDFAEEYNKYLKEQEENKIKRKKTTKYLVNIESFLCNTTTSDTVGYRQKAFDSKKDATEYANKGLKRLQKKVEKYLPELIRQDKILDEAIKKVSYAYVDCYGVSVDKYLSEMMVSPLCLKEGDMLAKVGYTKYNSFSLNNVDKDYSTTVKGFKNPEAALLSDNTLLFQSECRKYSIPMFIKAEAADTAQKVLLKNNIRRVKGYAEEKIKYLNKLAKYAKEYVPFKKYDSMYMYFYEKHIVEIIKDIDAFIEDNNLLK